MSRARQVPFLASDGLWAILLGKGKTCKSQNEYELELHDDVERLNLDIDRSDLDFIVLDFYRQKIISLQVQYQSRNNLSRR